MTSPPHSCDIVPYPMAPIAIDESGLSLDLVLQLALKTLHFAGELTGTALAGRLGLRYTVIEPALDQLKSSQHVAIVGGSTRGSAASFRYRVTDAGRVRAALFLDQNQYVGPAPVALADYQAYMRAYARQAPHAATQARVREAFSHLVVRDDLIDQIGPAVNAGRSLFIYGPPGNGKTVMARAVRGLLDGDLAIPHAIAVEGQIVRVFDPVNHEATETSRSDEARLDEGVAPDGRWVRCRRPLVMVGGELTLDALQLTRAPGGFYKAPVQLVANGGVLVIDDFGRQQMSPAALLNRWSVPLESRVDFLSLESGQMFEVPFALLIVFATNLRPTDLVDEAFLRRIHAKVYAHSPTWYDFTLIFRRYCVTQRLAYNPALVHHLQTRVYEPRGLAPRACHPRDLIDHALALAEYRHAPRELTPQLLEAACAVYFVDDRLERAEPA